MRANVFNRLLTALGCKNCFQDDMPLFVISHISYFFVATFFARDKVGAIL
jgi:hypothetical protein